MRRGWTRPLPAAILVGHSIGCQIAAEVAARRPDLVAGVVLIGPTSDPAARTIARQIGRAARSVIFERPSLALWASLDYTRAGPRVLLAEMRQIIAHRLEEVLPHVSAPVRVVRGGRDGLASQGWAEAVARLAGAPKPIVIPGWGHAVHYDQPRAVARVVLDLARALTAVRALVGSARQASEPLHR